MDNKPDFLDLDPEQAEAETPEAEPIPDIEEESSGKPMVTFRGNSYDLTAVVAVTIGGVILLSCATCNMGLYCLPFVPIILGSVALISAKDSVDPDRTKLLSWLGIGAGIVVIVIAVLFFVAYFGLIFFAIGIENAGFGGY